MQAQIETLRRTAEVGIPACYAGDVDEFLLDWSMDWPWTTAEMKTEAQKAIASPEAMAIVDNFDAKHPCEESVRSWLTKSAAGAYDC